MNMNGLQLKVAYWPAMILGGTLQLEAAHCPNEWTLDPAVCSYNRPTYVPVSCTMAFSPQCSPATTHPRSAQHSQAEICGIIKLHHVKWYLYQLKV